MSAPATYPLGTISNLLMLTDRRVQQLAKEGHVPRADRGRYELVPVVQAYIRFLRDRAINGDVGEGGEASDKARLMKARADIAEMEAQRLADELVPAGEVEHTWTTLVGRFRSRALAVPSKAAPLVAMETTTEACHDIVETFIHEALADLASTEVDSPAEDDDGMSNGAEGSGPAAETDDLGVG